MGKKNTHGFTLIELMIAVAILGIIASIAYPSYRDSVLKAGRADAKASIMEIAQQLERCFTTYGDYTNAACNVTLNTGIDSTEGKYTITPTALTATSYTLTAAPKSGTSQAADSNCSSFTYNNLGSKGPSASVTNGCWK